MKTADDLHGLDEHLDDWVRASLIRKEQAEAIRAFEAVPVPRPRIGLVTEALGYLGAAMATAAGAVLIGRSWDDLAPWVRVAIPAVAALLLLGAGWALRQSEEAAIVRLTSVLWVLGAGMAGWFGGELAFEAFGASDRVVTLYVGAWMTVVAVPLYLLRRTGFQQLPVLAGLGVLAGGIFFGSPTAISLAVAAIGFAWMGLGWIGRAEPREVSLTLGALMALFAEWTQAAGGTIRLGIWLGIATSVGLLAASVSLRHTPLLGIGAVGLFAFLVRGITYYFRGTLGMPIVLLFAGVAMLVIAFGAARLRTRTGGPGMRGPGASSGRRPRAGSSGSSAISSRPT